MGWAEWILVAVTSLIDLTLTATLRWHLWTMMIRLRHNSGWCGIGYLGSRERWYWAENTFHESGKTGFQFVCHHHQCNWLLVLSSWSSGIVEGFEDVWKSVVSPRLDEEQQRTQRTSPINHLDEFDLRIVEIAIIIFMSITTGSPESDWW